MSLADYRSRFKKEVHLHDFALGIFLTRIEEDSSYNSELRTQCEEEIVVPFLKEKLDKLSEMVLEFYHLGQNRIAVRIMDSAKMWPDVMRGLNIFVPRMKFCEKLLLFQIAGCSESCTNALITCSDIVPIVYTSLYGCVEPPVSTIDMLNHLTHFNTAENFEHMELISKHSNSEILKSLSDSLRAILKSNEQLFADSRIVDILNKLTISNTFFILMDAKRRDEQNENIPDKRCIFDKWIDEGLMGMLGRNKYHHLNHRLDHNPFARAMMNRIESGRDAIPAATESYRRLFVLSDAEIEL